jgi:hypothetical protein
MRMKRLAGKDLIVEMDAGETRREVRVFSFEQQPFRQAIFFGCKSASFFLVLLHFPFPVMNSFADRAYQILMSRAPGATEPLKAWGTNYD